MVVKINIVPVTCGKMDALLVCALIREMTHGVMERKVITMISTLRKTVRTRLVIAIKITGNVMKIFVNMAFLVGEYNTTIGSVRVD